MVRWAPSKCDVAGCATMIDDGATPGAAMRVDVRICQKDAKALANGEAVLVVALAPAALARVPGCHCVRQHGGVIDTHECPIHGGN